MPEVIDAQGNPTGITAPYTSEGVQWITEQAQQMGGTVGYSNEAPPDEFSQQAMGQQGQINADQMGGMMQQAMMPQPPIDSPQTGGMY